MLFYAKIVLIIMISFVSLQILFPIIYMYKTGMNDLGGITYVFLKKFRITTNITVLTCIEIAFLFLFFAVLLQSRFEKGLVEHSTADHQQRSDENRDDK